MLDFSNRAELNYLADLARAIKAAVGDISYYLAGAQARNLLLQYAHGINPGRDTADLDLGLTVSDWDVFEKVREGLIERGPFTSEKDIPHKLKFHGRFEVDLIPFGAVERPDRTIAFPPDGTPVMSVFGFSEAYEDKLPVLLPREESIRVVSLRALALLKLIAWRERRWSRPGADARDFAVILRHYLDAGNRQRLYTEAGHLLEAPDFDYEFAGAWLLGHDIANLVPKAGHTRLGELLDRESDVNGPLGLLGDMGIREDRALGLLRNLTDGFQATSKQ